MSQWIRGRLDFSRNDSEIRQANKSNLRTFNVPHAPGGQYCTHSCRVLLDDHLTDVKKFLLVSDLCPVIVADQLIG